VKCEWCSKPFEQTNPARRFCSLNCRTYQSKAKRWMRDDDPLLRTLNDARLRYSGWAGHELVRHAERALEQHDYDARAGVDARQATIWEVIPPSALKNVG